jgi:hypothetical protein
MNGKTGTTVFFALMVASIAVASAHGRHAGRHTRAPAEVHARSFAPARMIEVRPGLWVGSYQCVVDLDRGGRDCSSGI